MYRTEQINKSKSAQYSVKKKKKTNITKITKHFERIVLCWNHLPCDNNGWWQKRKQIQRDRAKATNAFHSSLTRKTREIWSPLPNTLHRDVAHNMTIWNQLSKCFAARIVFHHIQRPFIVTLDNDPNVFTIELWCAVQSTPLHCAQQTYKLKRFLFRQLALICERTKS